MYTYFKCQSKFTMCSFPVPHTGNSTPTHSLFSHPLLLLSSPHKILQFISFLTPTSILIVDLHSIPPHLLPVFSFTSFITQIPHFISFLILILMLFVNLPLWSHSTTSFISSTFSLAFTSPLFTPNCLTLTSICTLSRLHTSSYFLLPSTALSWSFVPVWFYFLFQSYRA